MNTINKGLKEGLDQYKKSDVKKGRPINSTNKDIERKRTTFDLEMPLRKSIEKDAFKNNTSMNEIANKIFKKHYNK